MEQHRASINWLARYANNYHIWEEVQIDGKQAYRRPLGLVESSFNTDGSDYEGRADVNALLTLEIRSALNPDEFRRRILLAWASLRLQHVLMLARVLYNQHSAQRHFAVELLEDSQEALQRASKSVVFINDYYQNVDENDLYRHCLNTARVLSPDESLSRLFVLPLELLPNGNSRLHLLIVVAHEITDGLSIFYWMSHLIQILNTPLPELEKNLSFNLTRENVSSRLPPAQEDLYPPVSGSLARQRWFWAIMRILRHVRRPLPPTFANPLRRIQRLSSSVEMPPTYSRIFNYSPERKPLLNSFQCTASLSRKASSRFVQLTRAANASIGAGCFALVALTMMELEEVRHPDIPLSERRPFIASFPLNPRAFFGYSGPSDSCMLAFSDGIVLPFLASDLDIEGRFKLTARQAHRQLCTYQKRLRSTELNVGLAPRSVARLIANSYLVAIERGESKLPPEQRTGINPQGSYPANMISSGATCGVSSVGSVTHFFHPGMHKLEDVGNAADFAADFRSIRMGVRARDNEFLVGSGTESDSIRFNVSFDGNAIGEEAVRLWKQKIETMLDVNKMAKL